jgi:SpoU rRNA methylase family enzyme
MSVAAPAARRARSVRVNAQTYERARRLAAAQDLSISEVIERAIEQEERRLFSHKVNEAIERLRAEPVAWAAYQEESRELDAAAADGLDLDEGIEWDESLTDAATW